MAKLSSLKASSTHSVLLYGAPKCGKTLLAGKLAEHFNIIYVGLEKGHETLFQLPEAWQDRIEMIDLPDTRSYPIGIETVLKMVKGKVDICEAHGKVSCLTCKKNAPDKIITVDLPSLDNNTVVIFDSLTQLTNSAIANITKAEADDYKLTYDDWGNLGKLMDIFLSHIQQANYNTVVISHETEAKTVNGKDIIVPVGGTRNFSRNVAKYFGEVIYGERKNRGHHFVSSTTSSSNVLTGSRTNTSLENSTRGEASLLQIFKPELFPKSADVPKDTKSATSLLNKLRK